MHHVVAPDARTTVGEGGPGSAAPHLFVAVVDGEAPNLAASPPPVAAREGCNLGSGRTTASGHCRGGESESVYTTRRHRHRRR